MRRLWSRFVILLTFKFKVTLSHVRQVNCESLLCSFVPTKASLLSSSYTPVPPPNIPNLQSPTNHIHQLTRPPRIQRFLHSQSTRRMCELSISQAACGCVIRTIYQRCNFSGCLSPQTFKGLHTRECQRRRAEALRAQSQASKQAR